MTTRRHKDEEDEPGWQTTPKEIARGVITPREEVPMAGIFRVKLPGLRPLKNGLSQEYLDIEANSEKEAVQKFAEINGITATIHDAEVTRLPIDPQR